MNRRQFCTVAGTGLVAGVGGWIVVDGIGHDDVAERPSETDDTPSAVGDRSGPVHGTEPVIAQGEDATIVAGAASVTQLSFVDPPRQEYTDFTFTVHDISPSPDAQDYSYPPTWYWSAPTDVAAAVPVRVADDAPPGVYQYSIWVQEGHTDGTDPITETFELTVER